VIRVENVSVAFGRTLALDALDAELGPGVVGLFGPNGSGKSTLLRVVAGLLAPVRGRVLVAGKPARAADEGFRRTVAYVGHASGLYGRLTLHENLTLFATMYGVARTRVDEAVDALGLGEHAGAPVDALSAGLKRRAAVARALLHEPALLLLDEPYANLDDHAAEIVSGAIRAWRAPGRTAVIATHGAKKVKGWADAGVVLQRGRISATGRYGDAHRFERDAPAAR
jgi:heme ABC exporter ATP-binding subunit CcmA